MLRARQEQKKDHPRACGEYRDGKAEKLFILGSPPRLRGIHNDGGMDVTVYRITPAPAGNTTTSSM